MMTNLQVPGAGTEETVGGAGDDHAEAWGKTDLTGTLKSALHSPHCILFLSFIDPFSAVSYLNSVSLLNVCCILQRVVGTTPRWWQRAADPWCNGPHLDG